jgi:hypothetical protein
MSRSPRGAALDLSHGRIHRPIYVGLQEEGFLKPPPVWLPRESALGHRRETARQQRAHPRGARSLLSGLPCATAAAVASCHRRSLSLACVWISVGNESLRVWEGGTVDGPFCPTDKHTQPFDRVRRCRSFRPRSRPKRTPCLVAHPLTQFLAALKFVLKADYEAALVFGLGRFSRFWNKLLILGLGYHLFFATLLRNLDKLFC